MARLSKRRAIDLLQDRISRIEPVKQDGRKSPSFTKWHRDTETALTHIFGEGSRHLGQFTQIAFSLTVFSPGTPQSAFDRAFLNDMDKAGVVLQSMAEEIAEYWDDDDSQSAPPAPSRPAAPVSTPPATKVFLVHGHDESAKNAVARLLERIGLEPIILHERPDRGRTIIEKFEEYSDASYAVVLATADDEGRTRGTKDELRPRARQNVVLELGFFVGRLGRERVSVLYEERVEMPSDYSGVIYISMDDAGTWKPRLVKELRAAGLDFDANAAVEAM